MGSRPAARLLVLVVLSLAAVVPLAMAGHDDLRMPVFLRAADTHVVEGGRFLLHAGNEGPARVHVVGAAGDAAAAVYSTGRWTLNEYGIPQDGSDVRVETEAPVWLVPVVERVDDGRVVMLGCSDIATHLFWIVDAEEVRLVRDHVDAPRVRLFTPLPGLVVPDEVAVREHTVLLEPADTPIYLEVVPAADACAGNLVLEAGLPPGASPFARPLGDLFWAIFVAALVIIGVLAAIWWVGLRRDRRRRQAAVVL